MRKCKLCSLYRSVHRLTQSPSNSIITLMNSLSSPIFFSRFLFCILTITYNKATTTSMLSGCIADVYIRAKRCIQKPKTVDTTCPVRKKNRYAHFRLYGDAMFSRSLGGSSGERHCSWRGCIVLICSVLSRQGILFHTATACDFARRNTNSERSFSKVQAGVFHITKCRSRCLDSQHKLEVVS